MSTYNRSTWLDGSKKSALVDVEEITYLICNKSEESEVCVRIF